MDIVTQGLLGGALAQAGARKNEARIATLTGFCAGLLADADAFIQSTEDPLLYLEFHRHFSHALVFIPVGALLAAIILWPFLKTRLAFKRIYLYALLGYATSGFLDACTSYGTSLLIPFSDTRIAWSIISIFDPLFSLILIVALIYGVIRYQPVAARIGLVFAGCYLLFGLAQHERATMVIRDVAIQRGHSIERLIVKPTMANLVLWRTVYEYDENYYVDAVRVAIIGESRVYKGNVIRKFYQDRDLPHLPPDSVQYQDVRRFQHFSDGFLAWHPSLPNVLGDVRYSLLPTSIRPLWGIELDFTRPDKHTPYNFYRDITTKDRKNFVSMVLNKDVKQD